MQLGIVVVLHPVIAIGPILQIIFNGSHAQDHPGGAVGVLHHAGRHARRAAQRGTGDARRRSTRYGGGRVAELMKVRIRAALPSLFAALRIAAPAAMLGAIIGEYMGGESGSASR